MGNPCQQCRLDNGKCSYWDEDNPDNNFSLSTGYDEDGDCMAEDADFPGDICENYQADLAGDYCDRCGNYLGSEDDDEESECICND